jgi:hypothetical protein
MSEVTLAGLLQAAPRGTQQSPVSPREAREEVVQWLRQLQRDAEQAGASPAQLSALDCLGRSFLGAFAALCTPWVETRKVDRPTKLGPFSTPFTVPVEEPEAKVGFNEKELFNQLRDAAEAFDDLLAGPAPPPPPEPKPWADDDKLLELVQPLFGALAAENGDAAIFELGRLAERLRAQDIEMLLADDTTADCFRLYNGNADNYVTVTPAIVVRGELRVRGEARRPRDTRPRGDVVADAGGSAGQEETLR